MPLSPPVRHVGNSRRPVVSHDPFVSISGNQLLLVGFDLLFFSIFSRLLDATLIKFSTRLFIGIDLTLGPHDVYCLSANIRNQLHLPQTLLLFLLIEDGADAVFGVFNIVAQRCDVLLLFGRVANVESAVGNGR